MKEIFYKYSNRSDLIAIKTEFESLSYKQVFEHSQKISNNLSSIIQSNQKYIPILSSNCKEFIIITIALWNLGLVPVPLNIKWTEKEIKDLITDNSFEIIFYEKILEDLVKSLEIKKISFNDLFGLNYKLSFKRSNDESVVIFTSGSSAKPKGVIHSFASLVNSIFNCSDILKQNIGDRWLASLPFYHIGGFQIICRALSNGCELILPIDNQINSLKNSIYKFKPTHISLVAAQLNNLLNEKIKPDKSLKVCLIGGGFSEDNLLLKAQEEGWNPIRVYGSTETASLITAAEVKEIIKRPNTVGRPVKNVKLKVSNENEILISTNSLFKNYLNNETEFRQKVQNGFYYSGDLGTIDEDEYLFIEAKRTDLIVSGGENINPYEVENALLKIPSIKEACVFPIQDVYWGQIVAALLVLDGNIDEEHIKNELKKELSSYKIPKKFFQTDKLPRTSLGKIEREKVKKMFN
jgi:O-succinylbenzoic acid--CoA ligase